MSKPISVKDEGAVVLDTGAGVVPDTVQEAAKRAVVFIDTRSRHGKGSGTLMQIPVFGMSKPVLVTCNHVIPDQQIAKNCFVSIDRYDDSRPGTVLSGADLFDLSMFRTDTTNDPGWGKLLDFTVIGVRMDVLEKANIPGGPPTLLPMTDYQNLTSNPAVNDLITVVHYPKDPPGFQKCTNPERILKIADPMFGHSVTTFGGSSGCPIFREFQRKWIVIGLHRGELSAGATVYTNLATHMSAVYNACMGLPLSGPVPAVGEFALEARKMTKESTEGESSDIDKDGSEVLSASQILEKYEDEFFEVVDATVNLPTLKRKNVVTEKVITKIKGGDSSEAKDYLYEHLKTNATVDTLRKYCKMISEASGFPRMQELGRKMLSELPPGK